MVVNKSIHPSLGSQPSAAPLLRLEEISLSFGGVTAISHVSLDVFRGEICAIIGPNGAGKSSLLNVVNGVYRANAGEIVFDGAHFRRITPLKAARLGIGRTFQHNALFKQLTVLDNVLAGLTRHSRTLLLEHALGLPRARSEEREFHRRAAEMLEFLELTAHRDTVVSALPYGIQKRTDLARALVGRPTLLLLDEPMAGMNQEEKREMSRFIRETNRVLGTTIILIEHDIGVVMGLSDRIVVLENGRRIAAGTPAEVRKNQAVIDAYLGVTRERGAKPALAAA
jgi:branched-chain amino acid transport system ATP-binding protein